MQRHRVKSVAGAAASLVAFLMGCRVFPEWQIVTLSLPVFPPVWLECGLYPDWEIEGVWLGGKASAAVRSGETAALYLPRDESAAVLAYPAVGGRRLRPAGAVLPRSPVIGGKVNRDWAGGYQAAAAYADAFSYPHLRAHAT